ncbi:HNH endonuclease signature motif containing protein [Limoniibacter endophyticus]|uniref:HNH domain-containing protein n=1 Tax=Limoniibacter endophyticus TaxID=1565040 RepID=A0A8J3DQA1_9HYPH|nr:HNH endonuclease signature motif containing protein [Limoniibacter endophyticus]GHC79632.1 hypothetical protein GCM10010136_32360 [Limoniibacter endophyticus]
MAHKAFTKKTMRLALERSGLKCEAVGKMYGLANGSRCNAPLSYGVEFDHIILDANSHDNSLDNCAAVCIKCHKHKTAKHDIPMAAKTVRQQDKHLGVKSPRRKPIQSQGFPKYAKTAKGSTKSLPPRLMFQERQNG